MVYAKLKTHTFDKFFELAKLSNILLYPDVIIYCTNKERRIVKNESDIYDHASNETLNRIDDLYEEAITYLEKCLFTKHIKVIKFENDFSKDVDTNLDILLKILKAEKLNG